MAKPTVKEVLFNPVFANNPIGLQILGICSALAVTSNLQTALVMSLALTLVTTNGTARQVWASTIAIGVPIRP